MFMQCLADFKLTLQIKPALEHWEQSLLWNIRVKLIYYIFKSRLDVLLDNKLKPWLLEVNHGPSFATDTELDFSIKSSLIKDTVTLMKINS